MKTETRVYVDITQLAHWHGQLTGILRVMDEFALRFKRDYPASVFVVWDARLSIYRRINFEAATDWYTKSEVSSTPAIHSRSLAGRLGGRLIREVRGLVPTILKDNIRSSQRRSNRERVDFVEGDVLFITWGEWGDTKFTTNLAAWNRKGLRLVHVIHDMGPIAVPHLSGSGNASKTFAAYCSAVLPICQLILVNSQFSKRAVSDWLQESKLPIVPIAVFRLGEDFRIASPKEPTEPQFVRSKLKGQDFILCVGTVEIKKNHTLLYYVYKLAKERGIKLPKLIIVGRLGWRMETMVEVIREDPEMRDEILIMQQVDDHQLTWLYQHCLFTVQASFYEGWGIPVAESLARGVPAICSNSSSMVEIADGIVDYFSPASTDECLAALLKLLSPKGLQMAKKRTKQYKTFSWDKCFEQVKQYMEATL